MAVRTLRRLPRLLFGVVWRLASIAVIAGAIALIVGWWAYGLTPLVVTSGSMSPGMPAGSVALVREVPVTSIRVGDVITFDAPGKLGRVTHRVIKRTRRGTRWYFQTKGDANDTPDHWQPAAAKAGAGAGYQPGFAYSSSTGVKRIASVPHLGRVFMVTSRPAVQNVLIFGALGLLALQVLARIWFAPEPSRPAAAEGLLTIVGEPPPDGEARGEDDARAA